MNPKALAKAQQRLRVMEAAYRSLETAKDFQAISDQWYVFLHAAKGIYITLQQGAKPEPHSMQWYGARNQERKDDELLRYVSEARNDDEHGIEAITRIDPGFANLGIGMPGTSRRMIDQNGNIFENCGVAIAFDGLPNGPLPKLRALDGKPVMNAIRKKGVKLKSVQDRSGVQYDPPTQHLGKPIEDATPKEVARLALAYLNKLVADAHALHKPSP